MMKNDDRERRRQWIRRVIESHFGVGDGHIGYLTDDTDVKTKERRHARFVEFMLDERDSDLKNEALYDMFLRICASHSEPKELDWGDVMFLSKVTGRSPEQVKGWVE